jgi:xylulose-5-phosphate/fructose-6-phosphate phosphoketolase
LQDDVYVKHDIKPRLLGHWGTCPGLTLVYSHLNILIREHDLDVIYAVGLGHGASSILPNPWLEGSPEKFYSQYTRDAKGLTKLISGFSTTDGFPSHINAETPGAIHEALTQKHSLHQRKFTLNLFQKGFNELLFF